MGFLNWIFGKKNEVSEKKLNVSSETHEGKIIETKMIPISDINPTIVPEGSKIVYESSLPQSCKIGNLIFEKKYKEAIELGLKLLEDNPDDVSIHINLMDAYVKGKDVVALDFLEKSTYYARQAILNGHNTGYAEERLAKNLDKAKLFHQSLQLYNLILDTEGFHFSRHGCGNGINWSHRRDSVIKKMDKALDTDKDILFSPEEIAQIIQRIKDNDNKEIREQERFNRIMGELRIAMKNREYEKYDRLFKELHKPID